MASNDPTLTLMFTHNEYGTPTLLIRVTRGNRVDETGCTPVSDWARKALRRILADVDQPGDFIPELGVGTLRTDGHTAAQEGECRACYDLFGCPDVHGCHFYLWSEDTTIRPPTKPDRGGLVSIQGGLMGGIDANGSPVE